VTERLLEERRTAALKAGSKSLFELVQTDEQARRLLGERLPDRAGYLASVERAFYETGVGGVRTTKRRHLAQIAASDLAGETTLDDVGAALSDLADACLAMGLRAVGAPEELAIIALGKFGGRELNYVSDIDVLFVSEGNLEASAKSAEQLLQALGGFSPQGRAFLIDVDLRPEGRSGALVRSLSSTLEYYRRWAQPWEHQALIKARWATGNEAVGRALVEESRDLVFPSRVDAERIASIRKIKARVEEHAIRAARRRGTSRSDDVKLGPGGIRDIEFSVQLLQLVHGGSDPSVRSASTRRALAALANGGYVAEEDGTGLSEAYGWLRTVEHRLQIWQERRVHVLPSEEEDRARLARSLGFADTPQAGAAASFYSAHKAVLVDVRRRFEKLFYRPMIESLADGAGPRLSAAALRERLRVLGFRDVDKAARTLEGLVSGTSRRAKLFRVLTPALLRWLSDAPLPDDGLLSFLQLGEALGERTAAFAALRDNPAGLALLAHALGSGRLVGDLLTHVPEELQAVADPEGPDHPKGRDRLVREALASLGWRSPERRIDGLRRFKRRELLRVALADIAATAELPELGRGLADIAEACLEAALDEVGLPFGVIGMGKLGGRELGYASDIDVMFVHSGEQGPAEKAAEHVRRAIGELTPEGQAFRIDLDLRPEGKAGALTRSLDAYLEYYARWAKPWEHLALVKARRAAGDEALVNKLLVATRPYAYPASVSPSALAEIRHLKARMERERIPRHVDPRRHIKLGPGALSDVEFAIQLLQMTRAHDVEVLRVTGTLEAISAAARANLISAEDAHRLVEAWTLLTRMRNRLFLMCGRPVDVLPSKPESLEALGIAMGYRDQPRQELEEHYLRATRRARKVAEPLIYG
jgi:glutamate-ammonia-ligase adenylyltransferase